jgi:hypothetical protein
MTIVALIMVSIANTRVSPLAHNVPIVDPDNGHPSSYFTRLINDWIKEKLITDDLAEGAVTQEDLQLALDGLELDDLADVDTTTNPPTTGDMFYFNGTLWVPLDSGAAGKVLTAHGAAAPTWETPATSAGYFKGATGFSIGAADTQAFATKGHYFTPDQNITVSAIFANIAASASGQAHHGQLASVNTGTGAIVTALGTTSSVNTSTTSGIWYRYPFASPIALTSGTAYAILVVNASGTGTTAVRPGGITAGIMLCPGGSDISLTKQLRYNTIDVTNGQAASSTTSNAGYDIFIEGNIA